MGERPAQGASQPLDNLVVIGSSAGGIEALSTVLGALAPDFPAPIVVAQHLDPTRPSHLETILGRRTRLAMRTVGAAERLAAGTVYLVPADRDVEIDDHEVRLRPAGGQSRPSINRLLSSAARAFGERLIAVILTGSGSDGAEGAREVKAAGGMVVIEDPATAAYAGMPRSLAPTTVDVMAHLDQIGPLLRDLLAGTYLPRPLDPGVAQHRAEAEAAEHDLLAPVLAQLRERSGIDFTSYRRPTILRRLQRRMAATKLSRLDDYLRYLARHPEEYQRLVSSFLIKVTEFFRDPELFAALRDQVLPPLIAQARERGSQLRLWSAGCATGEEAYSLAILVAEALGPELSQWTVRLFATDLDERAVAFARQGVYPATALVDVAEELRERYFTRLDGSYEIKKPIRGLVIFGEHDLAQRPPFPHIDLVLCRNVLIYFTPELQQRTLRLFAVALRPGGYLALGKAETVGALADFFTPDHPSLKLYRRGDQPALPPAPLTGATGDYFAYSTRPERRPHSAGAPATSAAGPRAPSLATAADEREWGAGRELEDLMFALPLGVVVVDRQYHIRAINAAALRLLDIYRPAIGSDLVHLAERVPGASLRRLIDAVFRARLPSRSPAEASGDPPGTVEPPNISEVVALETGLGERRELRITAYPRAERAAEGAGIDQEERIATALVLVSDVTGEAEARRAGARDVARDRTEPEQALARRDEDTARLRAELARVMEVNRQLAAANQDLGRDNLNLHRVSDELLLAQEQEQATTEEIRTLNEELQAGNEELETVNEEMEATVEELRAANEDLAARSQEAHELTAVLEAEKLASDAEQARLSAILLSMGDALLVVDRQGRPLLSNAAYARMLGDPAAPFRARDAEGHPLAHPKMPQQRVARGETFVMEFTLDEESGPRRYFEASGQPIASGGEDLGGVISIRDITERSLHRLQDEFMTLASHELRTPLTPLTVYLELLHRQFGDRPDGARGRTYAENALHQVWRLRRLVQDLLDARRLQAGGFSLDLAPVALDEVARRAVEAARTMASPSQTIDLEGAGAPLVVAGDAVRLEQVLMNLLSNAITYAPHAPRIVVELRRAGGEAEVRVRDEGPGIVAAELPRIFARFYQVERSDERPSRRGLGLGLYIAHELVVAHGGRIEVASVEAPAKGHGTTFTIHLPLVPGGENGGGDDGGTGGNGEQPGKRRGRGRS